MATQPNPEFLQETMFQDFGTKVLITDPRADQYLSKQKKTQEIPAKYSQWCGGPDGFDDFTERWHVD